MSVLASMRKVSYVEFLKTIAELQKDVLSWAKTQNPKDMDFGVKKLYGYVEDAFGEAYRANERYPNSEKALNYRLEHFGEAQILLHGFNAQLTIVNNVMQISNKKIKRWCNHSEKALRLLKGVIRSDKRKLKEYIDKEN